MTSPHIILKSGKSAENFRNGLRPLPLTIREATVTYDVMGTGLVKPEEYESMMKKYLGAASRLVSMNITK